MKKLMRKAGQLLVLVVDASGRMAIHRMSACKGAAISLLQESYKKRSQVAVVASWGRKAELLVAPTKAPALAQSRLRSWATRWWR